MSLENLMLSDLSGFVFLYSVNSQQTIWVKTGFDLSTAIFNKASCPEKTGSNPAQPV